MASTLDAFVMLDTRVPSVPLPLSFFVIAIPEWSAMTMTSVDLVRRDLLETAQAALESGRVNLIPVTLELNASRLERMILCVVIVLRD